MPEADITFEELDQMVKDAKSKKGKKTKKKPAVKAAATPTKKPPTTDKTKAGKKTKSGATVKSATSAKSKTAKKAHAKSESTKKPARKAAKSAQSVHAKKPPQRLKSTRKPKAKTTVKSNEIIVKTKSKAKAPTAKQPTDIPVKSTTRKKAAKNSGSKSPGSINKVAGPSAAQKVRAKRENDTLLDGLLSAKEGLPPHHPVGHIPDKEMESELTDLYDDSTDSLDENAVATAEAEFAGPSAPIDVMSDDDDYTDDEPALKPKVRDTRKKPGQSGRSLRVINHVLNVIITTLLMVIILFVAIVQLQLFDIGIEPFF